MSLIQKASHILSQPSKMPSPSVLRALWCPASTEFFKPGTNTYSWEPRSPPWQGFYPFYLIFDKYTLNHLKENPFSTRCLCSHLHLVRSGSARKEFSHCHRWMKKLRKYLDPVKAVQVKIFSDSNSEKRPDH